MAGATFHALLIGADGYFPNQLSGSDARYPSLHGCVSDVMRVEAMLRERVPGRKPVIKMLVAPAGRDDLPTGDRADWPTADNIRRELALIAERAQPGDQVYIHYSGHGGRVVTAFKALKGNNGIDEALVPIDIGLADTTDGPTYTRPERYIRDVELALYLDGLAHKRAGDRRVTVTLVFDSCHSGGVTRGLGDLAKRSASAGRSGAGAPADTLDRRELDDALLDAETRARMAAAFGRLRRSNTRSAAPAQTSWLPPAEGYVLLAGCRDVESAIECALDGKPRGGVLTGAFLDAIAALGTTQSWRTVYDRVLACVHSLFASQTPQLLGDIDRHVFGVDLLPSPHTLAVTRLAGRQVAIGGGLALNLTVGTQLGIYAPGTTDFSQVAQRVASVTVSEADALEARAQLDPAVDLERVVLGAPVVIHALALRRKVELLARADLPVSVAAHQPTAIAAIARAIASEGNGFLEVAAPGETPHYQVAMSAQGTVELCDPQGAPFPYLEPVIAVGDPRAASLVVSQLRRLGRYHSVLEMTEPVSDLRDQLTVELLVAPAGWTAREALAAEGGTPLARRGDAYTVQTDTWIWLRLKNHEPRNPLNVALLDLNRKWQIEMIIPNPLELAGKRYETIADKVRTFAFKMFTPVPEAIDVLKLFIATGDVDFRALTTAGATRSATRGPGDALSRLVDAINAREIRTREVAPGRSTSSPWTVQELRMRTLLHVP